MSIAVDEAALRIAAALERIADRLDRLERATVFNGYALRYKDKPITELTSGEYQELWRALRKIGLKTE